MSEYGDNEVKVKPATRLVLRLHPYLPIEKEADGTGGGAVCRLYGAGPEPVFVRVVWGESTEIELVGVQPS